MEFFVALLALTGMEIVLGIDNIVFITIVTSKLPADQQPFARKVGLALALVSRLLLLFLLFYMVNGAVFQKPVFELTQIGVSQGLLEWMSPHESDAITAAVGEDVVETLHQGHIKEANEVSIKDIILLFGGLFLIFKSVYEIHEQFGAKEHEAGKASSMMSALIQIAILDVVFSLDSVITAVGMVDDIWVMVASIILAIIVMLIFAEPVSKFVDGNPTLKMLALSFMILIGVMLTSEAVGAHIEKGYIYFAMFFALIVEVLNLSLRKRHEKVSASH